MTSNIKKMYILFIVVREIEGKKASFEIRALQVRRTAGNVKVPRCFTFHKCDLSKKKFNRPLLVMLTQLNSTRRKAENWQSLRGESSAWWDVLSLESPFLTSRCLYIFVWRHFMFSEAASKKCFVAVLSTWILLLFMERWSIFSWDIVWSD